MSDENNIRGRVYLWCRIEMSLQSLRAGDIFTPIDISNEAMQQGISQEKIYIVDQQFKQSNYVQLATREVGKLTGVLI